MMISGTGGWEGHCGIYGVTPTNVNENNEMYGTSLMLFSGQGFITKHSTVRAALGGYTPLKDIGYNNYEKLNGINPAGQPEMKYMWIPNTENDVGE